MNITLNPELQRRIAEKVDRGDVQSADAFVEQAITFYLDYEAEMDDDELGDTKVAIDEALAQGERDEGRPAKEVFSDLRAKYGLRR
jgi:Arc/MetJ-type ribon-helix-helix transcriptional regulator